MESRKAQSDAQVSGSGGKGSGSGSQNAYGGPPPKAPETRTVTATSELAVTIAASADSFATDTFASVSVNALVSDRGLATFACGSVTATAVASGGSAYSSVAASVDISGADVGQVVSCEKVSADGSFSSVTTSFLAVDFKFDLQTPGVTEENRSASAEVDHSISGNLADFSADIRAEGENSLVDLAADAIAVEDSFSSTTLVATAAVSSTATYKMTVGTNSHDILGGTSGNDLMFGGRGNDYLAGKEGADWLFGDAGNDILLGGGGDDTMFGGDGLDLMYGAAGNDWLFGGAGDDLMEGAEGHDLLLGGRGADLVCGGAGNDLLSGDEGKDCLFGEAGDDIFRLGQAGGDGNDVYAGGSGADGFLFAGQFGNDTIIDFRVADGDRLLLGEMTEDWSITLRLVAGDRDDLQVLVTDGRTQSSLLLDEFFACNASLGRPQGKQLTSAEAEVLMGQITAQMNDHAPMTMFGWGDLLSSVA